MVDMKMTVRGLMALAAEELEQFLICSAHNPPPFTEAFHEAERHRAAYGEYKRKAYELMGVNTIEVPTQQSFFDSL